MPPLIGCFIHPQNVQLQNVQLKNIQLPNAQLQNVQDTKRPGYKTSIYQTSSYRTSRIQNIQDTKCPVFVNFKLVFKKPFCEKYQGFTSIYRQLNANFGYFCPQMTIQIFLLEIRVFSATFVPESFHNHA